MSKVRTFRAKVKNEQQWDFPAALVAVRHYSKASQETGESPDGIGDYVESSDVEAIAYRGNFWPSVEAQLNKLASLPLINEDNPDDPDLFTVDLEHLQSVNVINSSMDPKDKTFKLIELDIIRRFA